MPAPKKKAPAKQKAAPKEKAPAKEKAAPKKKAPAKKKAAPKQKAPAKKARMAAGLQPQPLVARTEDGNQFCAPCDTYSVVRRALRLADARRAK